MQTQPAPTENLATSSLVDEHPRLYMVPADRLPEVYPLIRGWLDDVAERSQGRWNVSGMLERFVRGDWQLWFVWTDGVQAVVGTELHVEMTGMKCCLVRFCTGNNAKKWVHLLEQIEDWARLEGCGFIHTLARKGWARHMPDYTLTHIELTKELI